MFLLQAKGRCWMGVIDGNDRIVWEGALARYVLTLGLFSVVS